MTKETIHIDQVVRKRVIEKLMGVTIIKVTNAGPSSTWSYLPGGGGRGYDSELAVIIDLEDRYLMANLLTS